jgi:hypothetical protein
MALKLGEAYVLMGLQKGQYERDLAGVRSGLESLPGTINIPWGSMFKGFSAAYLRYKAMEQVRYRQN